MSITKKSIYSIEDIGADLLLLTREHYFQCNAYSKTSLDYRKIIAQDNDYDCTNESYAICINDNPVVTLIGAKSKREEITNVDAYSGRPCLVLLNHDKTSAKINSLFFKELDSLLEDVNGVFRYRDPLLNGCISSVTKHILLMGGSVTQSYTQVIDLETNEIELKKSIRKSFKSLINWGARELDIIIRTSKDIRFEDVQSFKELHYIESGRRTRSDESWEAQYNMIKNNEAFLVTAFFNKELVSVGFFTMSSNSCYYGASASRSDLFQKPLFHSIMWTAIKHGKKLNLKWFETGEQIYEGSKKELGISFFKAGFGGFTRSYLDVAYSHHSSK